MKNAKKLLSLVVSLAMIALIFSVIPMVPASAAAGDVFSVTNLPDGWRFYSSSYVTRTSGSKFTLGASTNKGNGLDNYGILAANSQSADIIRASTTYRIKFRVETWFTLSNLQVDIDTGTALWSRTGSIQTFTDLASRSSNSSGGGSSKLYTDLTFDVTTPSTITGNQHFVIGIIPKSGTVGSTANLAFKDITITELGTYNVIDEETGESIGAVHGLEDDDVYELLENAGLSRAGYYMVADPEFIESDTEDITVSYTLDITDVQNITFDSTYAGGSPNWHYIPDNGHIALSSETIHHDTSTGKGSIGDHSVTLANSYGNSGLVAGGTYRVTFTLKTFPRYTPLESLKAEIRFGTDIWTNIIDSATISMTGEELAAAVTNYSAAGSGSVTFTLALTVTLPESGWSSATARNILLGIYGGEYWLDNVTISTTGQFKVVDGSGNQLGKVCGRVGDQTASLIPASMVGADYTFTTSPATIETYRDTITLTKTMKSNIAQAIDFGSDTYGGNTETGTGNYYSKDSGAKMIKQATSIKGEGVNVGNTFGFRSVVLANNLSNTGLEAGNTYRVTVRFNSWYALSNFGLQVKFGRGIWNTIGAGAATYTGDDLTGKITVLRPLTSNQSGNYELNLDVTLPESSAWDGYTTNKNILISLYGAGSTNVEYWLSKAYIYKPSTVTVTSYDGSYTATIDGYEGDAISEAVSTDGSAKFIGLSGAFGVENQNLLAGKVIFRGDANADFTVDSSDLAVVTQYLLGVNGTYDLFGINANYSAEDGNDAIDIRDLIRLKKIAAGLYAAAPTLPAGLHYNNYESAWNCEFNGNSVTGYFDMQWGHNRNLSDVDPVGMGEKKYSYVKDGALVLAPDDNYGAGNTIVCDAYTTKTTMKFTYGYLEICAKLPFSNANAPAFWLKSIPADSSDPTFEIDLLETFGSAGSISTNIHCWKDDHDYNANAVTGRSALIADPDAFHKYGVEWYKEGGVSKIAFYVDGVLIKTMSKSDIGYNADFDQAMYLILENVPITADYYDDISDWAASASAATHSDYPMDVIIDYVRLYQSSSNTGNTLTNLTSAS